MTIGSILPIGSYDSFLSIGRYDSFLSIGSYDSFLSIGNLMPLHKHNSEDAFKDYELNIISKYVHYVKDIAFFTL